MKHKKLIIIAAAVVLGSAVLLMFNGPKPGIREGLIKVEGYRYTADDELTCQAESPECGICYGEIINKECYVDKDKLSDSELRVMRLKR